MDDAKHRIQVVEVETQKLIDDVQLDRVIEVYDVQTGIGTVFQIVSSGHVPPIILNPRSFQVVVLDGLRW